MNELGFYSVRVPTHNLVNPLNALRFDIDHTINEKTQTVVSAEKISPCRWIFTLHVSNSTVKLSRKYFKDIMEEAFWYAYQEVKK